jgi:hypothetical protein
VYFHVADLMNADVDVIFYDTTSLQFEIDEEDSRIKEVIVGDGARRRRYVVCVNPVEAERQRQHRRACGRTQDAAQATRGESHSKRTSALLSTPRFARYLRARPLGWAEDRPGRVRRESKLDGKWVIISNDDTLSAEDLALGYKQLMRVEQCWHTVKGGQRTRPLFHWTPHRNCAHVSLCVLALLVERIAEIRAKDTWRNLRDQLETIKVVEYQRGEVHVLQTTEIRPAAAALIGRLKVELPPKIHGVTPSKTAAPSEALAARS